MTLSLILQIGEMRFALDARDVVEVLPLVQVQAAPAAPAGVAGFMNYRGAPIPVIDLSQLCCGRPARRLLSTRLLLVRPPAPANVFGQSAQTCVGLLAERATEIRKFAADAFTPSPGGRSLGFESVAATAENELIYKLDLAQLLGRFADLSDTGRATQPLAWTPTPSPSF